MSLTNPYADRARFPAHLYPGRKLAFDEGAAAMLSEVLAALREPDDRLRYLAELAIRATTDEQVRKFGKCPEPANVGWSWEPWAYGNAVIAAVTPHVEGLVRQAREEGAVKGPPRGESCPTCRMTRWEGKQLDGWLDARNDDIAARDVAGRRLVEALTLIAEHAHLDAVESWQEAERYEGIAAAALAAVPPEWKDEGGEWLRSIVGKIPQEQLGRIMRQLAEEEAEDA